jgi:hypothetical protein
MPEFAQQARSDAQLDRIIVGHQDLQWTLGCHDRW